MRDMVRKVTSHKIILKPGFFLYCQSFDIRNKEVYFDRLVVDSYFGEVMNLLYRKNPSL